MAPGIGRRKFKNLFGRTAGQLGDMRSPNEHTRMDLREAMEGG